MERKGTLLAPYSTFQLGGPCQKLIECAKPAELVSVLQHHQQEKIPYVLLGGGSNILIADAGVDAVVVRYFTDDMDIKEEDACVIVSGSTLLDNLVRWSVESGREGLVMCSGIPGTTGGAIVGNAGAFGRQIGDAVEWVDVLNAAGRVQRLTASALAFGYRCSRLQTSGEVVLAACLRLSPGDAFLLKDEREELLALRREKHPDWRREPCIGSIFRNVEPTSAAGRRKAAGWFLEEAGAKDFRVGGAYVYPKHANIVIKGEGGTSADVRALIDQMQDAVWQRFAFKLEREVRFLGAFAGLGGQSTKVFF